MSSSCRVFGFHIPGVFEICVVFQYDPCFVFLLNRLQHLLLLCPLDGFVQWSWAPEVFIWNRKTIHIHTNSWKKAKDGWVVLLWFPIIECLHSSNSQRTCQRHSWFSQWRRSTKHFCGLTPRGSLGYRILPNSLFLALTYKDGWLVLLPTCSSF